MNRTPLGSLKLQKAIEGFLQFKTAEGISENTLITYRQQLRVFLSYLGNLEADDIGSKEIVQFLSWLRLEYVPKRVTGNNQPLSNKSLRNYWITLASFFRWLSREFSGDNPMTSVASPRFEVRAVEPFKREEIEALLKACNYSRESKTQFRKSFVMRRDTAKRDTSVLLTLLDTGVRASEFCSMQVGDFEPGTGKLLIKHGRQGGAKFGKGRIVYLGKSARKALWRYLADREDGNDPDAPLFVTRSNKQMTPNTLRQLICSLGERAQLPNCHPHRFRHTFAITYLRSGGDIFTLQSLLGHRSLEMVRHYSRVAAIDIELAHRRASPVDNWRL